MFHGPEGLKAIAQAHSPQAERLVQGLEAGGYTVEPQCFFDTFTVEVGALSGRDHGRRAAASGSTSAASGKTEGSASRSDETVRPETIEAVWRAFGLKFLARERLSPAAIPGCPGTHYRTSDYLTHPILTISTAPRRK